MGPAQLGVLASILVPFAFFALIFGIIYLRNKEKMAMIERGMDPRTDLPKHRQSNPAFTLTSGLLLIGSGLGLFLAYLLDIFVISDHQMRIPALYFSLIAIFGGSGLFTAYLIEKKSNQKKEL